MISYLFSSIETKLKCHTILFFPVCNLPVFTPKEVEKSWAEVTREPVFMFLDASLCQRPVSELSFDLVSFHTAAVTAPRQARLTNRKDIARTAGRAVCLLQ